MITLFVGSVFGLSFIYYLIKGLCGGNLNGNQPIVETHQLDYLDAPVEFWDESDEFLYTNTSWELKVIERQQKYISETLNSGEKEVRRMKKGDAILSTVPLTDSERSKLEMDFLKLDRRSYDLIEILAQLERKKERAKVS